MSEERFSMVQECVDSYAVEEQPNSSAVITIIVPQRFVSLWMSKLSDLTTTESEIDEYSTPTIPPDEVVAPSNEPIEMAGECTDSYRVEKQADGGAVIMMKVPKRFAPLWMSKLSDLHTTEREIDAHG